MGYDQSFTQRRLDELQSVFERDDAAEVVDPSAEGLKRNAATLLKVLGGLRELSDDLSAHAAILATGPNADPKVVAALPHCEELINDVAAAWASTAKLHEALQDSSKSKFVDPSEVDLDDEGWERVH